MDELKMVSGFLISIYALAVYKVYLDTFLRKQERFHAFSGWSVFFCGSILLIWSVMLCPLD